MRYLSFLLVLSLLVGIPCASSAKTATNISISAPDKQIPSGETFTVSIDVDLDTAITGAQFDLSFDPSIVTVVAWLRLFRSQADVAADLPGVTKPIPLPPARQ